MTLGLQSPGDPGRAIDLWRGRQNPRKSGADADEWEVQRNALAVVRRNAAPIVGQNQGDGGRLGLAAGPGTTVHVNSLIKDGSMS
jgi:hypothetical protein